jgi:hypothetical protein
MGQKIRRLISNQRKNYNEVVFIFKMWKKSWAWRHIPIIPALRRLRQDDCQVKASLGYIVRP